LAKIGAWKQSLTRKKEFVKKEIGGRAVLLELKGVCLELWEFDDLNGVKNYSSRDLKEIGIRHLAFAVDNLEKTIRELSQKGVVCSKISFGVSGHRYSFLSDPNGVALELYEK
jgi:glyoxylase I family protein